MPPRHRKNHASFGHTAIRRVAARTGWRPPPVECAEHRLAETIRLEFSADHHRLAGATPIVAAATPPQPTRDVRLRVARRGPTAREHPSRPNLSAWRAPVSQSRDPAATCAPTAARSRQMAPRECSALRRIPSSATSQLPRRRRSFLGDVYRPDGRPFNPRSRRRAPGPTGAASSGRTARPPATPARPGSRPEHPGLGRLDAGRSGAVGVEPVDDTCEDLGDSAEEPKQDHVEMEPSGAGGGRVRGSSASNHTRDGHGKPRILQLGRAIWGPGDRQAQLSEPVNAGAYLGDRDGSYGLRNRET